MYCGNWFWKENHCRSTPPLTSQSPSDQVRVSSTWLLNSLSWLGAYQIWPEVKPPPTVSSGMEELATRGWRSSATCRRASLVILAPKLLTSSATQEMLLTLSTPLSLRPVVTPRLVPLVLVNCWVFRRRLARWFSLMIQSRRPKKVRFFWSFGMGHPETEARERPPPTPIPPKLVIKALRFVSELFPLEATAKAGVRFWE